MTTLSLAGTASHRGAVPLAWCAGALAVGGLVTAVANGSGQALTGHAYEDAATALLWAFLAGTPTQQTRHPVGRIFLVVAWCAAIAVAAGAFGALDVPGSNAAAWVASWIGTASTVIPPIPSSPCWLRSGPAPTATSSKAPDTPTSSAPSPQTRGGQSVSARPPGARSSRHQHDGREGIVVGAGEEAEKLARPRP